MSLPTLHIRYTPASASCGLPGCSTSYTMQPSIQHHASVPSVPPAPLSISYEEGQPALIARELSTIPKVVEYHPEVRHSTGIYSLGC